MTSIYIAAAPFVLPVSAAVAAGAAAFVAFLSRRESGVTAPATFAHSTDLVPTNGWAGSMVTRTFVATSYTPQSRGSTG